MKKWIKRTLIVFAIFFVLLIVFIGYIFFELMQVAKADQAYQQRMEQMLKNPPIFNKNAKGEYRMVVRLGESPALLDQRNPNLFAEADTGVGLGANRPVLSFEEIPNIRLELLDENYERVFDLAGFRDIVIYSAGFDWIGASDMSIDLFRINDCSLWEEQPCDPKEVSELRYQQYRQIVDVLKQYGWQPYIPMVGYKDEPFGYARVLGQASWDLELQLQQAMQQAESPDQFIYPPYFVYPDGYYIDSYEKWEKYVVDSDIFVHFYKNNLLLSLAINGTVSYIDIKTNTDSFFYRYDEHTRVEKWQTYLAADIPKWQAKRKEAEDILRAQGYTIDESYVDAPLPKVFLTWQASQQSHK